MDYKREPIEEFPDYQIDTNGVVYNKKGKPLKYSRNKHGQGYCIVQLRKNQRTYGRTVHILVAKQFIENPENKPTVNHIDGDKTNNCISNLEWATYSEQMQHCIHIIGREASNIKPIQGVDKTSGQVIYNFRSLIEGGQYFAERDNINSRRSAQSIWRALSGQRHSYKGCIWTYTSNS